MQTGDPERLLALAPPVVTDRSRAAVADAVEYFSPDGVWLLSTERAPRAHARCRGAVDDAGAPIPVVHTPLGREDGPRHDRLGGAARTPDSDRGDAEPVDVVSARTVDALPGIGDALRDGDLPAGPTFVVAPVDVAVNETRLETTLPAAPEIATLAARAPDRVVVLSECLPADYEHEWTLGVPGDPDDEAGAPDAGDTVTVPVHGLGPTEGYGGQQSVACLTLSPAGTVGVENVGADRFGLRALDGIGPRTADRLRSAGVDSRAELRETPRRELTDIEGVGRETAARATRHAEVLATGEPLRLGETPLPAERAPEPPLCVDIETDGLSPSIVWQVGVYDPATDEHRAFTERNPDASPGDVIEAFLLWLLGTHPDRDLLTWNGHRFDYRHLTAFVERYVPEYAEAWGEVWKHDLYDWAVRRENALLPGRTNGLKQVARRLGYTFGTSLDGAATAAAYQRFRRTGEPLDWERHESYCEDDCRALWHVYDRLRAADRRDGDPAGGTASTDSEQAGLTDF